MTMLAQIQLEPKNLEAQTTPRMNMQGDFAQGMRTVPAIIEGVDFARGQHNLPMTRNGGPDYARGERTLPPTPEGSDYARGVRGKP